MITKWKKDYQFLLLFLKRFKLSYNNCRGVIVENISKKVISIDDCGVIGYILDVCLDNDFAISGYYVVQAESEDVAFLPINKIEKITDAVIVKNGNVLEYVEREKDSLIGKEVYDESGNFYGSVRGVEFAKNKLFRLYTDRCEIMKKYIKNLSGNVILCGFTQKRRTKNKQFVHMNHEISVSILSDDRTTFSKPEKVSLSPKFYVGKCAHADVIGYNNERIVRSGEKITKTIFENAKKHNKLNELFFVL